MKNSSSSSLTAANSIDMFISERIIKYFPCLLVFSLFFAKNILQNGMNDDDVFNSILFIFIDVHIEINEEKNHTTCNC